MNKIDLSAPKEHFPVVTLFLLVANLVVFLGDVFFGMDWLEPDTETVINLGANVAGLTLTGDSWRLLSSMFMHSGVKHLAVNMYMLVVIGMVAERAFGRLPFLVAYLISGLGGGVASALWHGYHHAETIETLTGMILLMRPVASVGASGAIMGIAGACFAARVVEYLTSEWSRHVLNGSGKAIAQIIGINLIFGFLTSGVDQAAHVGGLAVGLLFGGLLFAFQSTTTTRRPLWLSMALGVAALAAAVSITHTGGSEELRAYRAEQDERASERASVRAQAAAKLKRQRAQAAAKVKRQQELERIAENDARKMPAPVSEIEAAGVQISLEGGDPRAFAVSASGKHIYVTDGQKNVVRVIDLERKAIVRVIHGPELLRDKNSGCPDNLCRGIGASGIAISKDEQFAYVTSMVPNALSIVDLTTDKVAASIPLGRFPREVMLSDDEQLAFVMNSVDNSYSVVDLTTRKVLSPPRTLKGGSARSLAFGRPLSTWMSLNGATSYFFDALSQTVAGFDGQSRSAQRDHAIGNIDFSPLDILPIDDQTWLLFANFGLVLHDVGTGSNRLEYRMCSRQTSGFGVALSPDRSMLAVADFRGFIHLVKLSTGRTVGLYPATQPHSIGFSSDGKFIYVLTEENQLSILDVAKSMDVKQDVDRFGELYCPPPSASL